MMQHSHSTSQILLPLVTKSSVHLWPLHWRATILDLLPLVVQTCTLVMCCSSMLPPCFHAKPECSVLVQVDVLQGMLLMAAAAQAGLGLHSTAVQAASWGSVYQNSSIATVRMASRSSELVRCNLQLGLLLICQVQCFMQKTERQTCKITNASFVMRGLEFLQHFNSGPHFLAVWLLAYPDNFCQGLRILHARHLCFACHFTAVLISGHAGAVMLIHLQAPSLLQQKSSWLWT